jgi:hypothetical protein
MRDRLFTDRGLLRRAHDGAVDLDEVGEGGFDKDTVIQDQRRGHRVAQGRSIVAALYPDAAPQAHGFDDHRIRECTLDPLEHLGCVTVPVGARQNHPIQHRDAHAATDDFGQRFIHGNS